MKWHPEERNCPVCGESPLKSTLLGQRGGAAHHLGLGLETGIVRCRSCHAVYPRPMMIPEGNPYLDHPPEDYFELHDGQAKVQAGEALAGEAEELIGSPGRMLEIGCGRGELLRGAANRGWQVGGVDLTEPYAVVARERFGVDVEVASADDARSLHDVWDVILLAAVLEHVYEPTTLIDRVARALRPGGLVFIDVPNECSLYAYVGNLYRSFNAGRQAVNLSPTFSPYHVVGFCPKSLKHLLAEAGFKVVSLRQYPMESSFRSASKGLRGAVERAGVKTILAAGGLFGMGAGLLCWARKA